ncbi:osmolarity two-component system protein sln1 [Purpureocillium lavendulum]|uniref:histidine kinase n=1 Tax=Purpureocillium lavendulum TaxID=1247861 RepID=A0AB34G3C8_9HYPO|nr:osmolarity two-component system protein sln1 [Purpureocillium lavendulum]
MKLRVAIREQLAALVILAVLVALAIVSIPTWIYVHNFVVDVESNGLSLTASLKASRIASEIDLVQTLCQTVATRILLQQAFVDFYNGNATQPFANAQVDLHSAMSTSRITNLLQARLYSRNTTGSPYGLVNVTGAQTGDIDLPYNAPDGSRAKLSDTPYGYPPSLYPNITYENLGYRNPYEPSTPAFAANAFTGVRISDKGGLLLGPLVLNESYALMSLTVPVRSLNTTNFILGYMTLVASAESLIEVQRSREGLGSSGMVLFVGPANPSNHFTSPLSPTNSTYSPPRQEFARSPARFVLPPIHAPGETQRHWSRDYIDGQFATNFPLSSYPGVFDAYYKNISDPNNATALLSTTNEQGVRVAVGVARPQSPLVDWAVVVEKAEAEAYVPISTLRKILLGCVFGTAGLIVIFIFPTAHLSVLPIRRLKAATEKSINPPGYEDEYDDDPDEDPSSGGTSQGSRKGIFATIRRKFRKRKRPMTQDELDSHRRVFKIPGRVEDRKHFVTDELTELTETFNEMTDELLKQYNSLDEKVAERTKELEISKRAAEAANESKTLFIANISHELKTPLNGIMGMCAVCMEEDDIFRIKQSLKTLYRSGDLLLHLLEDLLSFSKNQIGQHVSLEEREFRLGDIRSQMLSIFDKQVRESKVAFAATFVASDSAESSVSPDRSDADQRLPALGPLGMGRLKDAYLWGDQHRILQVIINLVSPVEWRGQQEIIVLKDWVRKASPMKGGTALSINPMDPKATPHVHIRERSPTPPPPNAKPFMFEFEVEDTGRGIPEHMLEKVFEPFVQGDLGLSKKFGGTGLGLSICAQLAKLMGGSITVKSTIDVGSTFTMQIPLKYVKDRVPSTASSSTKSRPASVGSTAAADTHRNSLGSIAGTSDQKATNGNGKSSVLEDKQPRLIGLSAPFFASNPHAGPTSKQEQSAAIDKAMANKAGQGKLRVLVADDNSTNIEVVSRMLKLEDVYDVTIAKDGQEAYELVKANMEKNQHFDVIFMDIQMPNLDGLQSTRLIRKMGYLAPIVALTAFSEESNVRECMESGMDEFLAKPIRRPALKKVLTKFATIPEEPETAGTAKRIEPEVTVSGINGKNTSE